MWSLKYEDLLIELFNKEIIAYTAEFIAVVARKVEAVKQSLS